MREGLPNFSLVLNSSTGFTLRGWPWFTRTFPICVVLVVTSFSPKARADKPSLEQYWAQTGIGFEFIQNSVWQCDDNRLLACVQSLNVGAAAMKPKAIFATEMEARAESPTVGRKIKSFGPLSLYELREDFSEGLTPAKLRRRQLAQRLQIEAITDLVRRHVKPPMNTLLRQNQQAMLNDDPASEGLLAGQMTNAYLSAVWDPHTHVAPALQDLDRKENADDHFSGIGAVVEEAQGQLVVGQLLDGGGAAAAGLHARDVILTVNSQSVAEKTVDQLATLLHGPEGTSVEVSVERKQKVLSFKITRRKVTSPNVTAKIVNDFGTKFGYLKLGSFMDESACRKIQIELRNLSWSGAEALIIDLRGNGGGLLSEATCIGSLFVGKKKIVEERSEQGQQIRTYVGAKEAFTALPMVTLINGTSASASELLAGALQDHQRSLILGERSFGKGTMQEMSSFGRNLVLYTTISRFYLPSGRTNQAVGVLPDIPLAPFPGATEEDAFTLREADAYTNALPALGPAWVQPRPQFVEKIANCLKQNGKAALLYQQRDDDAAQLDYQILASEEALLCERANAK
jgi:carboxyl-terminal processing protease